MKFTGGISGRIYGSPNFEEGDFVETTPIATGSIENGSVVVTKTGSRYFLSSEPPLKKAALGAKIKDSGPSSPTITLTAQRKKIEEGESTETPKATFSLFGMFGGGGDAAEKPAPAAKAPTKQLPKRSPTKPIPQAKKAAPAQEAKPAFGFFGGSATQQIPPAKKEPVKKAKPAPKPKPAPKAKSAPRKPAPKAKPASKAPAGVPQISRWKQNADGSVSGNISGSPAFRDGERVTTSPIVRGRYSSGEVVTTGSGSRYYLA